MPEDRDRLLKEHQYLTQVRSFKEELNWIKDDTHPELNDLKASIQKDRKKRLEIAQKDYECAVKDIEAEHTSQVIAAKASFEGSERALMKHMVDELENKKRLIENEKVTLDKGKDSKDYKPETRNRTRRRNLEPELGLPILHPSPGMNGSYHNNVGGLSAVAGGLPFDKRKRPFSVPLYNRADYQLAENEIYDDLKEIGLTPKKGMSSNWYYGFSAVDDHSGCPTACIKDGELFYDDRWFCNMQPVYVEGKDGHRYDAVIVSIGLQEITLKLLPDNERLRINLNQLIRGKYVLKRRILL